MAQIHTARILGTICVSCALRCIQTRWWTWRVRTCALKQKCKDNWFDINGIRISNITVGAYMSIGSGSGMSRGVVLLG